MSKMISRLRFLFCNIYIKIPMLIAFGYLCLFGAAIAQNYFSAIWSEERASLQQLQLLVAIQEGTSTQYAIELNRVLTSKESTENQRLDIAGMYANHTMVLLSLGTLQALGSETNVDNVNITELKILDTTKLLKERKDINGLLKLIRKLQESIRIYQPKMIQDARNRYSKVTRLENMWNTIFLGLYVLGSLSIAAGYWRSWKAN